MSSLIDSMTPTMIVERLKEESLISLINYMNKFLREDQYLIEDSHNGFNVKMTYLPRVKFEPDKVVHGYFNVNLQKVKRI